MNMWHKIRPFFQERLSAYRQNKILKLLDKAAKSFHVMSENLNFDIYSNGELFLVKALHKSGNLACVFDVGANVGEYSSMVHEINSKCLIIAFEPVINTFQELKVNTSRDGIQLYNLALGSHCGKASISVVPENNTLSSLVNEIHAFNKVGKNSEILQIDVQTASKFLSNNPDIDSISLLKIDTEGFEPEVLKGFGDFLSIASVIQLEYGRANLLTKYFIHDYFRDYSKGFYIGKLYPKGVLFYETYKFRYDDFIGPNLVLVSKERPDIRSLLALPS